VIMQATLLPGESVMSRTVIARVLLVALLLGSLAACNASPTAPSDHSRAHDTIPWN
jgi:hypothetical protein